MARSTTSMKKKSYPRCSDAYRQEALALADRIGVAAGLVSWAYMRASFISGALKRSFSKTPLNESSRWQKKTPA